MLWSQIVSSLFPAETYNKGSRIWSHRSRPKRTSEVWHDQRLHYRLVSISLPWQRRLLIQYSIHGNSFSVLGYFTKLIALNRRRGDYFLYINSYSIPRSYPTFYVLKQRWIFGAVKPWHIITQFESEMRSRSRIRLHLKEKTLEKYYSRVILFHSAVFGSTGCPSLKSRKCFWKQDLVYTHKSCTLCILYFPEKVSVILYKFMLNCDQSLWLILTRLSLCNVNNVPS